MGAMPPVPPMPPMPPMDDERRPRVLLLGVTGQLGAELARQFAGATLLVPLRAHADFTEPERLRALVRETRPEVILNAAAYTAVDRAEQEPELADCINHQAVRVLAEEAHRLGALLVHYSTDYVFDGSGMAPWQETDTPAPLNTYGATKLAGERAVAACCPRHVILRTSWVYSATGHNFLLTMLRLFKGREHLRIVGDQMGAPTSAEALAVATYELVSQIAGEALAEGGAAGDDGGAAYGIYHATCAGRTSWFGFAQAILERARMVDGLLEPGAAGPRLESIASEAYPTPAKRPLNSVLANGRMGERGICLPPWEVALDGVFGHLALSVVHPQRTEDAVATEVALNPARAGQG